GPSPCIEFGLTDVPIDDLERKDELRRVSADGLPRRTVPTRDPWARCTIHRIERAADVQGGPASVVEAPQGIDVVAHPACERTPIRAVPSSDAVEQHAVHEIEPAAHVEPRSCAEIERSE